MTEEEKIALNKYLEEVIARDIGPAMVEAVQPWVEEFRERIHGTNFEHEMLNGNWENIPNPMIAPS